ncbi:glyoxalase/bleomycin resistance/extradiol dioxygenase family protein [Agromyces sp. Marseille-P2726]|uniref:VOC family protein n=1 Tax=Agromyces sp. Marseille-P2726 TaxID=2709132 RepID=UPI00156EBA1C|nr:glyoxalase superfamily protein [Agromyces sp. Marseille-P2726]
MIESAFPILEVSDMAVALTFYRDTLGGVLTYSFPLEGGDPVYVSLAVGSSSLGIGFSEAPPPPGNVLLWFYVDDVDRVTAEAAAAGASVLEQPVDQAWGERTSLVADPFGTRIRLGAAIAPPPTEE